MTDDEYRDTLTALEAGTLQQDRLEPLSADVMNRLVAARVPERYRYRVVDVFGEYWTYMVEWRRDKEHDDIIVKAAVVLADALKNSGKSGYFTLLDNDIWLRAAGDSYDQVLKKGIEWPPNSRDFPITLENYLRALVDELKETHAEPKSNPFGWLGDVMTPQRESRNLKMFVIRRARHWVDLTGEHKDWKEEYPPMPKDWRPSPQIDPDDKRAPRGNNKITARLASILLCSNVESKDVTQAFKRAR